MNRAFSRRIAGALAMPVLAAGLIGGGAVVLSSEATAYGTAYASPAVMAVAIPQPAVATAQLDAGSPPAGHRSLDIAPAAATPVVPARFNTEPFLPAEYPTSA
ncbi:MAG: hypothetical protein WBB07_14830 [Mycobacterium sp.]